MTCNTSTNQILDVSMLFEQYHIFINYQYNLFEVSKRKRIEATDHMMAGWETILSINEVPQHLTPSNALEKLKLYLLFS